MRRRALYFFDGIMKPAVVIFLGAFGVVTLSATPIYAQKCERIEEWFASVSDEFPDIRHWETTSGGRTFKVIRYNLLSDKYFVPFFGKTFESLSEKERKSIARMIFSCEKKTRAMGIPISWYLEGVFVDELKSREALNVIQYIENVRRIFTDMKLEMLSDSISELRLRQLDSEMPEIGYWFLPVEFSEMLKEFRELEANAYGRMMLSDTENMLRNFLQLNEYTEKKKHLEYLHGKYRSVSGESIARSNAIFMERLGVVLDREILDDTLELSRNRDFKKAINIFRFRNILENVKIKYAPFDFNENVRNLLKFADDEFSYLLDSEYRVFAYLIDNAPNHISLQHLDRLFFKYFNADNDKARFLSKKAKEKEVTLEKIRIDDEKRASDSLKIESVLKVERNEKLTESIKRLEEENISFISPRQIRSCLEAYEYLRKEKTYRKTEFDQFIITMQKIGFSRINTANLSDREEFRGPIGQNIKLFSGDDNRASNGLLYTIPRKEERIISLFMEDFKINYSPQYGTSLAARILYSRIRENFSLFYTYRNYVFLAHLTNDKFQITASDNSSHFLENYTDDINDYTVRVTPWTNTTAIPVDSNSNIYIKTGTSLIFEKSTERIDPNGNPNIRRRKFVDGYEFGALLGSFDKKKWFLIGSEKTFGTPPDAKRLYLILNCAETETLDGHMDVYYNRYKF